MTSPKRALASITVVGLVALGACSGGGSKTSAPRTSTTSVSSTSIAAGQPTTSVGSAPTSVASFAPPSALQGPVGGPVPSGATAVSVTFDSPTEGFVLADAPCANHPCTSVLRTRDAGRSWVGIPAPRAALGVNPQTQLIAGAVEAIRFGSALDGWVFGPALYATHDGGATWHLVSLSGPVVDLEASDGQVFALVSNCPNATPECDTPSPVTATLWQADTDSDQWSQVAGVTGVGGGLGDSIYLHGTSGWVVLSDVTSVGQTSELYYTSNDATWHRIANPCTGTTPGIGGIAAVASTVGFLCNGQGSAGSDQKTLVLSTDGGNTTRVAGMPPSEGDGGTLAALSPTTWLLANASAASWFYRSTDGGATWATTVTLDDGGEGFRDFGFTTASQGVAIHGWQTNSPQLIISRDGGTTWNPVAL